jgi:hypothetical protein
MIIDKWNKVRKNWVWFLWEFTREFGDTRGGLPCLGECYVVDEENLRVAKLG